MRAVKLCQRGVKDSLGRRVMLRIGAGIGIEMSYRLGSSAAPAPYALPAGFAMFLAVGTAAAALHGRLSAGGVLIACAAVAFFVSFTAEPVASVLLAGIGWLTVIGFSRPPYAQLRPAGPAAVHAVVVVGVSALAGAGFGLVFRWYWRRLTLVGMGSTTGMRRGASSGVADGPATARAREEAASLLELAQTVLGGADSPAAVLEHLTRTHGGRAELQERVAGRWVRAASSELDGALPAASRIDIRDDLTLMVTGQAPSATPALLAGYAAQA